MKTPEQLAEEEVMRWNQCTLDDVGEFATDRHFFLAGYAAAQERAKGLERALEKIDELSKLKQSGVESGEIARTALKEFRDA